MPVETFECSETAAEPIEATEEAVQLMETLGLEGQKELVTPAEPGCDQRSPYREMKADERFTYGMLCPKETNLEEYKASPIPLQVLQVAAHAKSLGLFDRLVVWDRADAVEKDPVLLGRIGEHWSSSRQYFMLARWGEELETFVVLLKRACEKKREQLAEQVDLVASSIDATKAQILGMSNAEIAEKGAGFSVELKAW